MTKSAKLLHIAQPAVSYTIKELEKKSAKNLFERINQRLVITDFGKELLVKAKAAVSSFEEFERLATEGGGKPLVRIGASITIGKTNIPEVLKYIKENHPDVQAFVSINTTAVIEDAVAKGKLDFALVEGKTSSSLVSALELSGDKLIAVARKDFNAPKTLSVRELAKYPLLLRAGGGASRELLEELFLARDTVLNPFIESSSNEALVSAVKSGLGIVILPSVWLEGLLDEGDFREIEINDAVLERKYYLIKHTSRTLSSSAEKIYSSIISKNVS
jgi:DNA-binding transcriptional LysR family regulator